jgi:hypothetical protein
MTNMAMKSTNQYGPRDITVPRGSKLRPIASTLLQMLAPSSNTARIAGDINFFVALVCHIRP